MLAESQKAATRTSLYPSVSDDVRATLPVSPLSIAERALDLVFQLNPKVAPVVLGGDHSTAWPVVSATARLLTGAERGVHRGAEVADGARRIGRGGDRGDHRDPRGARAEHLGRVRDGHPTDPDDRAALRGVGTTLAVGVRAMEARGSSEGARVQVISLLFHDVYDRDPSASGGR